MRRLERKVAAGADFIICPDNTIHQAFGEAARLSERPWLHIAEVVATEAADQGYGRLGITGTKYLMTGPVYPSMLKEHNIGCEIPVAADRERIDEIIFTELGSTNYTNIRLNDANGIVQVLVDDISVFSQE